MATIQCQGKAFQSIQAVLFDKDGTLADSELFLRTLGQKRSRLIDAQIPGVQEPLLMAFGLENDRINPSGLLAVGTRYENEIAAAAYVAETGRNWMESLKIARTAFAEADGYMQNKASQTPLFDGALELLQRLSDVGLKVGIVSSDTSDNVEEFVQHYHLNPWIELQMGSEMGLMKPDPAFLQAACERLGVDPDFTMIVGDSQADIQLARAAGAAGCIGVAWGWSHESSLSQADVLIHKFSDIDVSVA